MTATFRPSRGTGRSSRRLVRVTRLCTVVAVAALPLTACAAGYQAETSRERTALTSVAGAVGHLTLRNVFLVGPASSGGDIPLYMSVFNGGTDTDKLLSVSAAGATGGYVPADATIGPLGVLPYNEGSGVVPQLTGLDKDVLVGQTMTLKLVFQNAGELAIEVPVLAREKDAEGNPLPTPSAVPSTSPSAGAPTPAASGSATPSAGASATP